MKKSEKMDSHPKDQTSYSILIQAMQKKYPWVKVTEVHDHSDGTVKLTFFLKPQPSSKPTIEKKLPPRIYPEEYHPTPRPQRTKPEPTMEEDPQYWKDLFNALM